MSIFIVASDVVYVKVFLHLPMAALVVGLYVLYIYDFVLMSACVCVMRANVGVNACICV